MFCANCGRNLDSEALFCASCGRRVAVEVASDNEPSAVAGRLGGEPVQADQRNAGNVVWGAIWGALAWPSIFIMLLTMPKGPKRSDRIFGFWIGTGATFVVGLVIGIALVIGSSGSAASEPGNPPASVADSAPVHTATEILTALERLVPDGCRQSIYASRNTFTVGPKLTAGVWYVGCAFSDTRSDVYKCAYIDDASLEVHLSDKAWEICEHGLHEAYRELGP